LRSAAHLSEGTYCPDCRTNYPEKLPSEVGGQVLRALGSGARGDAPSWDVAGQTIAGVIAEFESACATSRQIAASFALDQTVPHDQLGEVSLRWIYVHIIREHARPAGHADIIREQIDGATGDKQASRRRGVTFKILNGLLASR
jgi:Protein of unknown function (DUF664)